MVVRLTGEGEGARAFSKKVESKFLIIGRGAVFYRYAPLNPKLPSTTIGIGQSGWELKRQRAQSGRVKGGQLGIDWILLGGRRPVKVNCR